MTLAVLRITLRPTGAVHDPYLLFRVRNGFEGAFRRAVGCEKGECGWCDRSADCPCRSVFAQKLSSDPVAVKRHQKPPLPFAFSFPVLRTPPNAGLTFEVRLALVGTATRFVTEFVAAIKILFAKHAERDELAAVVERVESLGYHDEPSLLYSEGQPAEIEDSLTLLTAEGLCDSRLLNNGTRIRLHLVTPLKIMREGKALRHFSFSIFMRTLMRRVSSLAAHYCDDSLSADFRWLASLCETVVVSNSSIRWVEWGGGKQGGKLAGLTGEVTVVVVPEEFIPFLLLGELLNVGKGAAFGLGRYSLAVESS
ncbi:MAG: CRISPR system precrRNA processing endoribonuclease RAMP protein Cas6 [Deltaproteobacteria bacterium]|nr:CRISPR system precrRNA processing endoribonuclease RAMP protein Cas6 [Deltaproteobacteria bacterium]